MGDLSPNMTIINKYTLNNTIEIKIFSNWKKTTISDFQNEHVKYKT